MERRITAGDIAGLLILAAILWFGVNWALDEVRIKRAEGMVAEFGLLNSDAAIEAQIAQIDAHIERCLKQGHKGNGC